jgi:c-di-GMP-binding flagellar brake protein YcgR
VTDKREHLRFAIELDATVETEKAAPVSGRTHDLSKGGLCMLTQSTLPIGTACRVKIALVFSPTEFSEQLTLPATIVWCTKTQGAFQLGVKFAQVDPQNRGYLDMFIKFLEGGAEEGGDEKPEGPDSIDPDGE